mgnify:CR=1 FL=1
MIEQSLKDDFNSIKVRLKLAHLGRLFFVVRFQFHKGTIKTHHHLPANDS